MQRQFTNSPNLIFQLQQRHYKKVLSSLPNHVIKAEYAVRGAVPLRGAEIMKEIKAGKKYPFLETTQLNIGNPQKVG